MIVKTFSGPNLRDALKSVRDAFGEDAVILDTKFEPGAMGRSGNRMQQVHVTAAFEPDAVPVGAIEGPRSLRLKGGLAEVDPIDTAPPNRPITEDSTGDKHKRGEQSALDDVVTEDTAQSGVAAQIAQIASALIRQTTTGNSPRPEDLLTWLSTRPKLAAEMIDAFATDTAESLAPYGPFLERDKSPLRVLFVGDRGSGKSNALFKTFATRWRQKQNAPGLIVVSESAAHNHERLAAICQSCGVALITHAITEGRLSIDRELRRRDLFVEYTPAQGDYDLIHSAKRIVKATNPDVIVLTVSATETDAHWARAAEKFAAFRPTHLALTRWDDDQPWWRMAGFARTYGLAPAYHTCGIDLFDEIDPFSESDVRTGLIAESTLAFIPAQLESAKQGRGK